MGYSQIQKILGDIFLHGPEQTWRFVVATTQKYSAICSCNHQQILGDFSCMDPESSANFPRNHPELLGDFLAPSGSLGELSFLRSAPILFAK